jgi:hypothetical protein
MQEKERVHERRSGCDLCCIGKRHEKENFYLGTQHQISPKFVKAALLWVSDQLDAQLRYIKRLLS